MRIFYILLSIILLTTTQAKSQVKETLPDPEVKIVKFYPNPAISYIIFESIEKTSSKAFALQIFNFLGRKVFEVPVNSETKIDLTNFVRGLYIFQLRDQNGRIVDSGKFQVNK
jgi:hypothetical protein